MKLSSSTIGTPSNSVPLRTVFWEELKQPTPDRFGGKEPFLSSKGHKGDDMARTAPAATLWKLIGAQECVSLSRHNDTSLANFIHTQRHIHTYIYMYMHMYAYIHTHTFYKNPTKTGYSRPGRRLQRKITIIQGLKTAASNNATINQSATSKITGISGTGNCSDE